MLKVSRFLRQNTVTVFNGMTSETENNFRWQATVLKQVRVDNGRNMALQSRGIESKDNALLLVELRDYTATAGRTYLNAKDWEALSDKNTAWTIKPSQDFFIPVEVPKADLGLSKEELMSKYIVYSFTDMMEEQADGSTPIILRANAK